MITFYIIYLKKLHHFEIFYIKYIMIINKSNKYDLLKITYSNFSDIT